MDRQSTGQEPVGEALFQPFKEEDKKKKKKEEKKKKKKEKKKKWMARRSEPIIAKVNKCRSFHSLLKTS
jgi:hypothetical protein